MTQSTLQSPFEVHGIGLHTAAPCGVRLLPAPADHGRTLVPMDRESSRPISVDLDHVVDTRWATTLGHSDATVATVEHLLAALAGLEIDNVCIEVFGPEIPILDGSAAPWVEAILQAGRVSQKSPRRILVVKRPVEVTEAGRTVRLLPASQPSMACSIAFDHPLLSQQTFEMELTVDHFIRRLAPARTFGFSKDVEALHRQGRAKGASLDNAIVVDDFSIRNPEGLRFGDEMVRHKLLDALGDLALLGRPFRGRYEGHRGGHTLNVQLVHRLLSTPEAWSEVAEASSSSASEFAVDGLRWSMVPR